MLARKRLRISQARVDRAFAVLWRNCYGQPKQRSMTLTAEEYNRLLKRIEEPENESLFGYFYDKLRKSFEIKVPTNVCEGMRVGLQCKIVIWVDRFENMLEGGDERIRDAAMSFYLGGLTTIQYPLNRGVQDVRTPDASFYCRRCKWECRFPNLVIEMGWAQNDKALAETAKSYIRGSKGITRTVVTFGMHRIYQAEEMNANQRRVNGEEFETDVATFSVWRASDDGEPIQTVADQEFRDKESRPVSSVVLELSLKDFVCREILASPEGAFEDPVLRITSEELCQRLNEGLLEYREYRKYEIQEEHSEMSVKGGTTSPGSNRRSPKRTENCVDAPKARRTTAQLGPIIAGGISRSAKLKSVYFRKTIRSEK
ncbi:hypothetical protein F4782DRAFT_535291 [Xylaria castorea]|nr:hypothetical protein F4782DRAFT_535291 [Xylaria castorea]